jgi:nucleotide-binding universal stress UspA family protein
VSEPINYLVLFAYDGSELARQAIGEAGALLGENARNALVITVWRPFDVGFTPAGGRTFDAKEATAVKRAADETAEAGAAFARERGFAARSMAVEGSPPAKAILKAAGENDAA